jgi:hypothetical protein
VTGCGRFGPVERKSRRLAALIGLAGALAALLALAPAAMAADGVGLAGRTDDKLITFFCFGVIAFFPLLVITLSLIQARFEKRKEQRRYDLERLS